MSKSKRDLTDIFQDIADAIREQTGETEQINPRDFADKIRSIPSGTQNNE